jgi:hypothetical protein
MSERATIITEGGQMIGGTRIGLSSSFLVLGGTAIFGKWTHFGIPFGKNLGC